MKKLSILFVFLCSVFALFATESIDINLEAEIQIKKSVANPSIFAWRDVLYVDTEVEADSEQDYKIRAIDIKKGYTNFELLQINGSSIKIDAKGKETTFKPGKIFNMDGGLIWVSFTAPDKKNYKLPTSIKLVEKKEEPVIETVAEEKQPEEKNVYKSSEPDFADPSFEEMYFIRDEYSYPDNGADECVYVDAVKQLPAKNALTNEQVVMKNLPDGTKSRLFLLDNKEVLVFLAPDLTLRTGANGYTLFYSSRKPGKDEAFSAPKRIIDNPKINGKVCNIAEFTGDVFLGGGKKKLVLVWTQFTKQIDEDISAEEICRTTAIYSCGMVDDGNMKWEKPEVVSEVSGMLQFHPEIYNNTKAKTLQLCFSKRSDNDYYSNELNPSAIKYNYYVYDKSGKWKGTDSTDFLRVRDAYPFTDMNSVIPSDFEYVFDKDKNLCGVVYSSFYEDEDDGEIYTDCFAKAYVKSPDKKQMIWTESVPVIYHKKSDEVLYPSAVVRPTGEWLVTYLNVADTENNLCVARVNVEPCLVTKTMVQNLEDMQHPNGTVRFTVEVRNQGLGIAEGCDVILRNEFNTEAGKVTTKFPIYPGTTYILPGAYTKLRGINGVVPLEVVRGEAKPLKVKNSPFAVNKSTFTMGIPKFNIGDIFVKTKGFAQKLYMTLGTANGVKVKSPGVELVLTEHSENDEEYEDNVEVMPIDYDLSDDYALMEYSYITGDFMEEKFEILPHLHFSEKSEQLPKFSKEEIEEMTSYSSRFEILNPLFTKESITGGLTASTFTKKTKVMEAEFVVTNNWPKVVNGEAVLELYNVTTNKVEKTMTVPFSLEVENSKKIKCAFESASSDVAADYKVNFSIKKSDE